MTTDRKLENLVEQKILEFLGDPDAGLQLKKPFIAMIRKRLNKRQKLISLSEVAKRYGIR